MLITYAAINLTPSDTEAAFDCALNGQAVVQAVDLVRAATRTHHGRGNRSEDLAFSVVRGFDTAREAEEFFLVHPAELPANGDLVITCGAGEDTSTKTLANAAYAGLSRRLSGRAVILSYRFNGGSFA